MDPALKGTEKVVNVVDVESFKESDAAKVERSRDEVGFTADVFVERSGGYASGLSENVAQSEKRSHRYRRTHHHTRIPGTRLIGLIKQRHVPSLTAQGSSRRHPGRAAGVRGDTFGKPTPRYSRPREDSRSAQTPSHPQMERELDCLLAPPIASKHAAAIHLSTDKPATRSPTAADPSGRARRVGRFL